MTELNPVAPAPRARRTKRPATPAGHASHDLERLAAMPLEARIHLVRSLHREHRGLQRARGDMDRRLSADARWFAVVRIRAEGGTLEPGKFPKVTEEDTALATAVRGRFVAVAAHIEEQRKAALADLLRVAATLPGQGFVAANRGFGLASFAALVGEAGDIGSYKSHSALWKRLGLAVVDGRAQRRVADKAEAERQGYNPRRRSEVAVIGENLIRAGGEWKSLYDARKAYEQARAAEGEKLIVIHRRAKRYMEKKLVRALYRAWRMEAGLQDVATSVAIEGAPASIPDLRGGAE